MINKKAIKFEGCVFVKKNRKKLSTNLITASILFAFLLSSMIGIRGYIIYKKSMIEKYRSYLEGVMNITMTELDNDELEKCINENKTSEGYDKMQEYLNNLKNCFDIKYIYIIIPVNDSDYDNMKYVMIGMTEEEKKIVNNQSYLGKPSGSEYKKEVAQMYIQNMKNKDKIEYYANETEFGHMYTAMKPLLNSNGEPIAVLSIDIAMNEVTSTLQEYTTGIFIGGTIITAVFLGILYYWLNKRIIKPIKTLKIQSEYLADLENRANHPEDINIEKSQIHTGDEIEEFSDSLYNMAVNLKKYMINLLDVEKEKHRIGAELSVATAIQANMLPRIFPPYPEFKEFDLYATMNPAKEVGGDFYDFFMIDKTHLAIVIGDVSGKGVPAALFMVISKTIIKNYAMMKLSPEEIFNKANNDLCEGNDAELFTTAWIGIYDLEKRKLSFCDAGHDNPILRKKDGSIEYIKPSKKRIMLAGMEGTQYILNEMILDEGDTILIYTDGVPEANNVNGEFFKQERLEKAVIDSKTSDPKDLIEFIRNRVNEFAGEAPQFDDITMLALRINNNERMN